MNCSEAEKGTGKKGTLCGRGGGRRGKKRKLKPEGGHNALVIGDRREGGNVNDSYQVLDKWFKWGL